MSNVRKHPTASRPIRGRTVTTTDLEPVRSVERTAGPPVWFVAVVVAVMALSFLSFVAVGVYAAVAAINALAGS